MATVPRIATWFLIRSAHAVRGLYMTQSGLAKPKALCGKWGAVGAPTYDRRPYGKSCENCLRILERAGEV